MNIILFNPALKDNSGTPSINLGDLIIGEKVKEIVKEIFPGATLREFSTHSPPTLSEMKCIQQGDLVLVGGTNLLSSSVQEYNQWKLGETPHIYLTPPLENVVLCGAGWWQYQRTPDTVSKYFYRRLLSSRIPHSVRDSYTAAKMREMGIDNVINTSCPTLWDLDGYANIKTSTHKKCLTCFTDYRPDQEANNILLEILLAYYPEGITIFPQGDHDIRDVKNLDIFKRNQGKIELLPHDISLFFKRVARKDADYIGTRLHAGAYCMANGIDSLILGVDNRSLEISKDINLPVIQRSDFQSLKRWLDRERLFEPVQLPLQAIEAWKNALRQAQRPTRVLSPHDSEALSQQSSMHGDRKLLNLGCGGRYHPDWTNVDYVSTGPGVISHNLMQPLKYAENTFDAVYHSHVLEHMPKRYGPVLLRECWRVLKPGGILRVVVPDLELAARDYLQQLHKAKSGDQNEIKRLEYLTISLLDQMTRHRPGGELLNYWKQNPMPEEDFVLKTHGLEVVRSLAVLRDPAAPDDYRKMQTEFDSATEHSAKIIGKFRISGEAHLWMYDAVSLKELLLNAGFSSVDLCQADESSIPNFNTYHLDVMNDGSTAKPESLFMEGIK
jgi:predicted SAM-dependent methyltransferase